MDDSTDDRGKKRPFGMIGRIWALVDGGWLPRLNGKELATLIALERNADRDGALNPGFEKLAEMMGQSERSIKRHMRGLVAKGLVAKVAMEMPGRNAVWRITLGDKIGTHSEENGGHPRVPPRVTELARMGDKSGQNGGHPRVPHLKGSKYSKTTTNSDAGADDSLLPMGKTDGAHPDVLTFLNSKGVRLNATIKKDAIGWTVEQVKAAYVDLERNPKVNSPQAVMVSILAEGPPPARAAGVDCMGNPWTDPPANSDQVRAALGIEVHYNDKPLTPEERKQINELREKSTHHCLKTRMELEGLELTPQLESHFDRYCNHQENQPSMMGAQEVVNWLELPPGSDKIGLAFVGAYALLSNQGHLKKLSKRYLPG